MGRWDITANKIMLKKTFFIVCVFCVFANGTQVYAELVSKSGVENYVFAAAASSYSVPVCKITKSGNMTIKRSCTGTYNQDDNTLTVDGTPWRVKDNPEYGQNTERGKYQYVAGGMYYFNL